MRATLARLFESRRIYSRGFNIVGIFDCDPFKIGEIVHGLEVHCTRDLKDMVTDLNIEIGIITTPPERAQRAAQLYLYYLTSFQ